MRIYEITGSVASVVSLALALWLHYSSANGQGRNTALVVSAIFIILTIVLHFLYRRDSTDDLSKKADHGLTRFTRDVEITHLRKEEIEVFYLKMFLSKPNLDVSFLHGKMDLTITEQRTDGFKFKTGSGHWPGDHGLWIRWVAEGETEN